jgi:hypothetical protein
MAGLLRVFSETNTAFVGVQLGLVLGLKAADLEAVFCGALLRDVGCGAVLVPFFVGQELARRLGGLRLRGVTERASWPGNPAPSCGSGWSDPTQSPCRPARRRPGSCRPASRANGRAAQMAARRTCGIGVPGAYGVREE